MILAHNEVKPVASNFNNFFWSHILERRRDIGTFIDIYNNVL